MPSRWNLNGCWLKATDNSPVWSFLAPKCGIVMAQQNCARNRLYHQIIWNVTLKITVFLCELFALFLPNQQPSAWGARSVFLGHWLGLRSTSLLGKSHDSIYNSDLPILSAHLLKLHCIYFEVFFVLFCVSEIRFNIYLKQSSKCLGSRLNPFYKLWIQDFKLIEPFLLIQLGAFL